MQVTALESKIIEIIAPSLEGMGYEIVRVQMQEGGRKTLQVMLEKAGGEDVSIDDCERASRQISALMDVEDPIEGNYNLEVSSPGVDRPLTREKDFERFVGYEVKISLATPLEGRKRFSGELCGVKDGGVLMLPLDVVEQVVLPFEQITSAKLIMNDALLAAEKQREI